MEITELVPHSARRILKKNKKALEEDLERDDISLPTG